jgi:hypothetical protein
VERAQIAMACLAAKGKRDGTRKRLAEQHGITRQSIYNIERKAREMLPIVLKPGQHGPLPKNKTVEVTREHLVRSSLVLMESGVTRRKTQYCMEQMLHHRPALGWVSERLGELAEQAAQRNAAWEPIIREGLSGDEIFSNGKPNLMVVGNESLYIYALTRQPARDGDTWGCVLLDTPDSDHFARDGGTGLKAGAKMAGKPDQLDWWHVLSSLWLLDSRLERKAYSALKAVIQREAKFDQARTPGRLAQHFAQWEKLSAQADQAIAAYDQYHPLAQQVDDLFAMLDVHTGQVRHHQETVAQLRALGRQIKSLRKGTSRTVGTTLQKQAATLCAYLPRLRQALAPLQAQWGAEAIAALCRIWQVEEHTRRKRLSPTERQKLDAIWCDSLDTAATLLGDDLFAVWDVLSAILSMNWRGSNAAECTGSRLRPHLNAHKYTDQPMLELLRFLLNTRPFERGKRAGYSPAELTGIQLPDDRFALLGL